MTPTSTLLRSARFIIPVLTVAGIVAELVAAMSVHTNGSYSSGIRHTSLTSVFLLFASTWASRQTGLSAQENQFLMQTPRSEISALYRDVRAGRYAPDPTTRELQRLTAVRTATSYSSMGLLFAAFCLIFPLENNGSRFSFLLDTAGMVICLAGAILSIVTMQRCHRFLTGLATAAPRPMGAPQAPYQTIPQQQMPPQQMPQ